MIRMEKLLHCLCRRIDDGSEMIECEKCKEWNHTACISSTIDKNCLKLEDPQWRWQCSMCQGK